MSKKVRYILSISGVVLVALFVGFYFLTFVITPNQFKSSSKNTLEKLFADHTATIGDVTINPGLSVDIIIKNIDITKNKKSIIKTGTIIISSPLSTFLNGEGKTNISIDKLNLIYEENELSNNWKDTLLKNGKKFEYPKNLKHLKISSRLNNINIDYKLNNGSKGLLEIRKLVTKNMHPSLNMAYEIDSKFLLEPVTNERVAFEALLIGDINIQKYLEENIFEAHSMLKVKNIFFESLDMKFPKLDSNIKFSINEKDELQGKIKVNFFEKDTMTADFSRHANRTFLDNIDMLISLDKVLSLVEYEDFNLNTLESQISIKGDALWEKNIGGNELFLPNITFSSTKSLQYKWNSIKTLIDFEGILNKNKFVLKKNFNLLGGKIASEFQQTNEGETNQTVFNAPFIWQIHGSNLNLDGETLAYFLNEDPLLDKIRSFSLMNENRRGKIIIDWENSLIDEKSFSGLSSILVGDEQMVSESTEITIDDGRAELLLITKKNNGIFTTKLRADLDTFEISPIISFLPDDYPKIKGEFNGTIEGLYTSENPQNYSFNIDLVGKNGAFNSSRFVQSISQVKRSITTIDNRVKNRKVLLSEFDSLRFAGQFNPDLYDVRNFRFVGKNNTNEITGYGKLYPKNNVKKNLLEFGYIENTGDFANNLGNLYGTTKLPVALKGEVELLSADLNYTLKKLKQAQRLRTKKKAQAALSEPNKVNEIVEEVP